MILGCLLPVVYGVIYALERIPLTDLLKDHILNSGIDRACRTGVSEEYRKLSRIWQKQF